jgi:hypothetical protein
MRFKSAYLCGSGGTELINLLWPVLAWYGHTNKSFSEDISSAANSEEEEGIPEEEGRVSGSHFKSALGTKAKVIEWCSKAVAKVAKMKKSAEAEDAVSPSLYKDPPLDPISNGLSIDGIAKGKRPASPSNSQRATVDPCFSLETIILPHIDAHTSLSQSSQILHLSYEFSPRVTKDGEFILHSAYTFTSPTRSPNLLSQIEASGYQFCPHISTAGKMRRKGPPRTLISEIGTRVYEDRCEFCWAEYEVEVGCTKFGVRRPVKVTFQFWHSLGDEEVWNTKRNGVSDEDDDEGAGVGKRGIRARWKSAL